MKEITIDYLTRAQTCLFITLFICFLLNGAAIYETSVIVPRWAISPPTSFQLLKELNLKTFWIIAHLLLEISFILTIIFCWKIILVRNWLLILFAIYVAVRVWTIIYFAPNLIEFQSIANGATTDTDLLSRATLWKNLNYIRTVIVTINSIGLIALCIKIFHLKIN